MPVGQGARNNILLGGLGRPSLFDTNIKATSIDEDIFTDQEVISSAEDADLVLVLDVSETPDQIKYMTKSNFIGEGLVAVSNNTDNYVATMTGSALNGEANLTFDGTILTVESGEVNVDISSGDPHLSFQIGSSDKWTIGADDSDSDKFKINSAGSLVDASDLILDSSGNLTLKGGITVGDSVSAMNSSGLVQVAGQTSITSLGTLTGLTLDGNKNVTPGDGGMIHLDTSTITDNATSGSGTATKYTHVTFEAPTLAATNSSVTTTSAATLYINAAPSAGTNQTLTNAYALWVDAGTAKLDGDVHVGGDLTVAGDDITMGTNTAGHVLVADDTNFNPVAVSGDVTMASTGAVTIANDAVESGMLNDNVISGQTEISSGLVDADELLYSDGGVLKKVGFDTFKSAVQSGIEGDITGVTLTADDTNTASDTAGSADFTLAGGANITTSVSGTTVTSALDSSVSLTSSSANEPVLTITNTHADATAGFLKFVKDPGSGQGADNDLLGTITFYGTDAGNNAIEELARMEAYIIEADDTDETSGLKFYVAENSGDLAVGLSLLGQAEDGEVDVTIGAGAASVTTIAGTLTMGSTAALTNAGLVAVANQSNITGVGTISSGTWQGTAIASTYIAGDAITGAKIADDAVNSEHYTDGSIDTAHIADDQVTLAKMAGLTRGSLIIGDASGDPSALAKGSANYVLTSDGTDIAWAAAATTSAFTSSNANEPVVSITNTHADATAGFLKFVKDPGSGQGADNDILGTITFHGTDASNNAAEELARMEAYVIEADHTSEAGGIKFYVAENDATMTAGLQILGVADADGEIDVTIGAGAASTTIIAGTLTMGSTAAMTNAGLVSVANQSNITGLGTISSGVWEGTDVAVAHGGTGASSLTDNAVLTGTGTSAITAESTLAFTGDTLTASSSSADLPMIELTNTHAGATAGKIRFNKDSGSGDDNDVMGTIEWYGTDAGENTHELLSYIDSYIIDSAAGSEASGLRFYVAENDATKTLGLQILGQADDDGEVDIVLGAGTASTTTVAGDLTISGGDITYGNGQNATASVAATAHNAAGKNLTLSAGTTTAGTTNNIAGGALTLQGGQGKGSGAGGDIIFQVANAGGSGSSLNSLATALTISDDKIATFADDIVIKDGGTFGVASANDALTISSGGIVTFKDDILIKDGGTIGNASVADVLTLASTGIVTFKDDIVIKDGGTIGVASAATAITIASTGIVTLVDDLIIKDAGTIGSASDPDAIAISSGGVVTFSQNVTVADDKTITLGEAGKIDFGDSDPDDNEATGIIISFTAQEDLDVGDVVYMHTDGKVKKADMNAVTTMPAIGICTASASANGAVDIMVQGIMHDASAFPTFSTLGQDVYVSSTGDITATAPSGSGDTVQKIGVAIHADKVYFNFNTTEVLLA